MLYTRVCPHCSLLVRFEVFQGAKLIYFAGLEAFKDVVFDQVKDNVVNAMLDLIERDREHETIDQYAISNQSSMFY